MLLVPELQSLLLLSSILLFWERSRGELKICVFSLVLLNVCDEIIQTTCDPVIFCYMSSCRRPFPALA